LETILQQLQRDGTNMAVVMDRGRPIGLITLEDILEEVVGRIEDEYPRLPRTFLKDSLLAGGVVLDISPADAREAITMLASTIPASSLPPGVDIAAMAWAREREVATDVGRGVAIPHARCPRLSQPVIVFGRCTQGVVFSAKSTEPVRLLFLLITPAERPNTQVFMLSQLSSVAHSELVRARLSRAPTTNEVLEIIAAADPAVTG
jgi:mannitol/fructose-specific phosphotransferase system IIA component (Ntr-type)